MDLDEALRVLEREGLHVRRVKRARIHVPLPVVLEDKHVLRYPVVPGLNCKNETIKKVDVGNLIEIRQGYSTDGLHKASKKIKFQERAPESCCFSIIFRHPKFVCKAVDFVADSPEHARQCVAILQQLVNHAKKNTMSFNEKQWLVRNYRLADRDRNGEIAFDELWKLLKKLNLQMSEDYVRKLFKETLSKNSKQKAALNEEEFIKLFETLSDLPEYRNALREANEHGDETLDAKQLLEFLTNMQKFENIDLKKAESIINTCEPTNESDKEKKPLMTIVGFRRLLQLRYGNILKENHETIFQDMNQPLYSYFINSSHNTYLTGLQVRGDATVEGYISALRKGARLLELDVFDGEHGEPVITHKRTFISAITLRNALKSISKYAFQTSPYPVILTLENHVGLVQQRVMADIFTEILGDQLYKPPEDSFSKPLPSPNQLKHKFLLRGKTTMTDVSNEDDIESPKSASSEPKSPRSPIDPYFGRLIALPSVKLTTNIYNDIQEHPRNGSPSLSESKVMVYLEGNAPIASYTATRLIKSYPKGIRQDSSNMNPIPSWLCGIQSVAMNMQTADEEMDLVNGLFRINGNCGYVLKPKVLLDGLDPRMQADSGKNQMKLNVVVICGQYLPKPEPGNDIVDPYVTLEIFGASVDECKARTTAIRNNGFNPVWNESFTFMLKCPELAILRFVVKDFDSTSSNDFIGEYSIPVTSIRQGYSHIRLRTGFEHHNDDAASIFVKVIYEEQ